MTVATGKVKAKTNRGAAKRFKATKSGRVKRGRAYKSHILTSKTRKRKRRIRRGTLVHSRDEKRVKQMIGY